MTEATMRKSPGQTSPSAAPPADHITDHNRLKHPQHGAAGVARPEPLQEVQLL